MERRSAARLRVTAAAQCPTSPPRTAGRPPRRWTPGCGPVKGYGSGTVPDESTADRRKVTVAVVNCLQQNVQGNSTDVTVKDWLEVFLVEPSITRGSVTNAGDVYVEAIRSIGVSSSSSSVQVVHKSVPYLIE